MVDMGTGAWDNEKGRLTLASDSRGQTPGGETIPYMEHQAMADNWVIMCDDREKKPRPPAGSNK